eukprot:gnl/TRDRNA2_/TRDRNA2_71570_c1_seq1.p1 gnl/TRDRNA2_/TRDRNA2_71570_c1~~gnl/TRDRNA2_/TRDRNA2_71570_c1_seq1.p1  ORF type:complete len:238 (+),score=32.46 gnl/TRDRNA2_/TRDRNA2_71570_c1_seq1:99-716(+)
MGIPGFASLAVFANPLLEVIPKICRQGVGKLPLMPYSAMCMNGGIWTTYGVLIHQPGVWVPNAFGLFLGALYTLIFYFRCPADADWLPYKKKVHVAAMAACAVFCGGVGGFAPRQVAVTMLGFTGVAACVAMFSGPLAAIRTVVDTQNTKSLPLGFTCATLVNCSTWLFYGLYIMHDPWITTPNAIGLVLAIIQLALFVRFGIKQ